MKAFITLFTLLSLTACTHLPPANSTKAPTTNTMTTSLTKTTVSRYDFNTTITRLDNAFKSKGMTVFAHIDHTKSAQEAGLTMQPATVIVFGTPKVGTPLMVKDPTLALELPLKVLVTETDGVVKVIYHDTHAIIAGSAITYDDVKNTLANAETLIHKTVSE